MSRHSHLLVSLFVCLLFTASIFTPRHQFPKHAPFAVAERHESVLSPRRAVRAQHHGAITVEAWIKLNSIGAYQIILSREAFQQTGPVVAIGSRSRTRASAAGSVSNPQHLYDGDWHDDGDNRHVASRGWSIRRQSDARVSGRRDGRQCVEHQWAGLGTGAFYIGRHSLSISPYYFGGLIDEVRVSAAALYTSNFTRGLGPGLECAWTVEVRRADSERFLRQW